ncbi:MAG: DNA polymerase III subunit gamma/tau [Candidatus Hydrogenedentota bacterium]
MYLALARKYRPLDFDTLIGQDFTARTLKNAIKLDMVHHAYLFSGCRGIGKTSTARILAKALNCLSSKDRPCNVCEKCTEINEDRALDVYEIDGASNRGIDEIRLLKEKVRVSPLNSKYKIYIIDEVHMLTPEAFNALLKTLEEPPFYVVFILATTAPEKLPPTIISRCQRFDFHRISKTLIYSQLKEILIKEKINFEDGALDIISFASDGSMRDALSLLDLVISYCEKDIKTEAVKTVLGFTKTELYPELLTAINKNESKKVLEIINDVSKHSANILSFIEGFIHFLRTLLEVKVIKNFDSIEYPFIDNDRIKDLALGMNLRFIEEVLENILRAYEWCKKSTFPEDVLLFSLHRISQFGVEPLTLKEITEKMMELYYEVGSTATTRLASNEKMMDFREKTKLIDIDSDSCEDENELNLIDLFLKEIDRENPILRAWLNPVKYVIRENNIIFTVASDRHKKEVERRMDILEIIFKKYLSKYNFKLTIDKDETISQEKESNKIDDKIFEAKKHPTVKKLKDILGGEVVEVED